MFHEIRFPTAISRAAHGGPERRTDVVVLGSGAEERNARWADSRRTYNAGYGVKSLDDLHAVIAFFEERRGRLHGFRWRDPLDWKSCPPEQTPAMLDYVIGQGDGVRDDIRADQDLWPSARTLVAPHHQACCWFRPRRRQRCRFGDRHRRRGRYADWHPRLPAGPYPAGGPHHHRRFRLRCSRALRHRSAGNQHAGFSPRRNSINPAH